MEKIRGIGGVFLRAKDKASLLEWYRDHLGIEAEDWGGVVFQWRTDEAPHRAGSTTWSIFDKDTDYFGKKTNACMINYRVDNLDKMLAQLRAAGVVVDDKVEASEYGKFGWAEDKEGNRVELWEPPEKM